MRANADALSYFVMQNTCMHRQLHEHAKIAT
jgi:hypothetical protein